MKQNNSELILIASFPKYRPAIMAFDLANKLHQDNKVLFVSHSFSNKQIEEYFYDKYKDINLNNIEIINGQKLELENIIDILKEKREFKYVIIEYFNCLKEDNSYMAIIDQLKLKEQNDSCTCINFFMLHRNIEKELEKNDKKEINFKDLEKSDLDIYSFDHIYYLYEENNKHELLKLK